MKKLLLFIALLCVIIGVPIYTTRAAQLPCTIDVNGVATCAGSVTPPNPTNPAPVPLPPAPVTPSIPAGVEVMHIGGTNNYAAGGNGQVVVYALPKTWPDDSPVTHAKVVFVTTPGRYPMGVQFEIAFSRIPGDFDYYKTQAASTQAFGQTFHPCGTIGGSDTSLSWGLEGDMWTCQIDSGPWYMNWRALNCTGLCGQTFGVPKG